MNVTPKQYDAYYAAADEAVAKIRAIENKYYYKRSQYIIDIFDDEIGDIVREVQERTVHPDTPGALSYSLGTLLEVLDPTRKDDVAPIFESLAVAKAWAETIEPLAKLMR